uniref:C2H2-type domain-containing protein n=1 Tax=Picocystis salinarum TaxID=88271 RepID=A0A6U9QUQ6_9CHLO|mmetsp:Transcript_213/g.1570  ORF Transcript_213/g.1570 Transcript_213/m.1570 type:complete len:364 (+) Transcript_213:152-1243(+)
MRVVETTDGPPRPRAGQKRLTNVAVVRYKKGGVRFEIACYKNKVLNWRNGIETDLDEVVQTTSVFSNVSKGVFASQEDLQRVFGTTDQVEIVKIILQKGELQVSDKERELEYATLFKDVVSIVVDKCVNPETQRPYPAGIIERTLKELHFAVDPKKTAKQQAMEAIPSIQKVFPIERAKMRLKMALPKALHKQFRELLSAENAQVERESATDEGTAFTVLIDPGSFRKFDSFVHKQSDRKGKLEVLSLAVVQEGVSDVHVVEKGLESLQLKQTGNLEARKTGQHTTTEGVKVTTSTGSKGSAGKRCATCGAIFEDAGKYREHFKGDWHKHNLKRKMKGLPPISEEEVENDPLLQEEKQEYGIF